VKNTRAYLIAIALLTATLAAASPLAAQATDPDGPAFETGQASEQPQEVNPAASPRSDMTLLQAVVLGIVEGVTEYLPVSSTGHLLVTQRIMGIPADAAANAYAICIQGGAILAVLGLYWRRCRQMILGLAGRDPDGLRLATNIFLGVLPAVIIGLPGEKLIKKYLFGEVWGLWPIVWAWFIGGVAILVVAFRRTRSGRQPRTGMAMRELTWKLALIIGLAQCVAMWPGVSRSLATIVGGVLVGLSLPAAVEFSFLLGVVTLGGATLKDAVEYGPVMLEQYGGTSLIIGLVVALISALIAVQWMVSYLNRHGLSIFGYYRVAIAILVAVMLWRGWL
jgi:undecaprenyl-diphosphatase